MKVYYTERAIRDLKSIEHIKRALIIGWIEKNLIQKVNKKEIESNGEEFYKKKFGKNRLIFQMNKSHILIMMIANNIDYK